MKLLLDMNLSPLWLEPLQRAGFDVVHWSSLGEAHAPDRDYVVCQSAGLYDLHTGPGLWLDAGGDAA